MEIVKMIKERLGGMETNLLIDMAESLTISFGDGTDKVFQAILDELEDRMEPAAYVSLCQRLEAN